MAAAHGTARDGFRGRMMEKSRVLHVITGLNDGGAEAVLYRLCKFDKENQHIVVSMMNEGKYGQLLNDEGVQVHCLNMRPGRLSISGLWQLFKLLRKIKPNVVQTWMYHADLIGGVVSRLAGVRNIVWGVHHTTLVKGESKRSTILVAKLNAYLSKIIPRKVIYCAQKSREVQESIGCNSAKGVVVSNGYDVNDFIPNLSVRKKFREELGLSDDVFLIGHVGRYDPQKDQKNLIEAISFIAEKVKNFKVVMVGTNLDSNNQTLNAQIQNQGLEKHLVLIGRRNDVPAVMNGLDLFVLSSLAEAFPNVLSEAMACGTPCVTTDVGDAALIIGNTGWVVPPKIPQSLADAIIQAIDEKRKNHSAWLQRKEACRNRIVENFSIEKMVRSYHQVWNS